MNFFDGSFIKFTRFCFKSGSKANVDVGGLEQQIQSVVDELIPVLKCCLCFSNKS